MASGIGFPFQGRVWYWVEATFGGGASGTTLPVSCYIQDVRVGSGDRTKPIRDIGSAQVCELMSLVTEPTLHVEYNPQAGDTLLDDVVDRTSCCTLQSLAFFVETNKCMPIAEDSQFYFKGCKPNTVRISGSKNEPYTIAIDFNAKSVVTTGLAAVDEAPAPLSGVLMKFNCAGSIAYSGHVSAFVTNSIDISIGHNLTNYSNCGSSSPDYIVEGGMDITGSCDITLDDGGGLHLGDVLNNIAFTLTLTMGSASGSPIITIPGCEWDTSEIDKNISGEAMIESAPFTSAPISCVTDGVCLTTLVTSVA